MSRLPLTFSLPALLIFFVPTASRAQPSIVTVSGTQLLVAKRQSDNTLTPAVPYTIKGVVWSPAARSPAAGFDPFNGGQEVAYGYFFNRPDLFNHWLQQEATQRTLADVPLIAQMNANTIRVFNDFGTDPATVQSMLDAFYNQGIMVIMVVSSVKADIDAQRYLQIVQLYKDHPAILMWSLGNEWNFASFGYANVDAAIAALNPAIAEIKAADPNHPVASILGDKFAPRPPSSCGIDNSHSDIAYIVPRMPGIDIWGLNIYRGYSFGTLFSQWQGVTSKPFFLSEFGTDSFRSTQFTQPFDNPPCNGDGRAQVQAGSEDRLMQASFDAGLWREISANLSANNLALNCVGGLVFNFSDQLWKVGNYYVGLGDLVNYNGPDNIPNTADDDHSYNSQNPDGFAGLGAHPDNAFNEEYFGIVTADRVKKSAYGVFKHYYSGVAPQVSAGPHRTVSVSSPAFLNGTVVDDGFPLSLIQSTWSLVSYTGAGAGAVTFVNRNALQTSVNFLDVGTYVLRLRAGDGMLEAASTVTLQVIAQVPLVIDALNASQNPVLSTQTVLSVLSHGGTPPFTYAWTQPADTLLDNLAAAQPTVTFSKAGTYIFNVIVQDSLEISANASISLPVQPTASSVLITTPPPPFRINQTYSLSATRLDQFGNPTSTQPTFSWSVSPAGASINTSGQFTATVPGGPYVVQATAGTLTGQLGLIAQAPAPVSHVYTVLSDKGISGNDIFTWSCSPATNCCSAQFDGNSTTIPPPEGLKSFGIICPLYAGYGVVNLQLPSRARSSIDLSAFSGGQLKFWVYTDNPDMTLNLEHLNGTKEAWPLAPRIGTTLNQWVPISIPLTPGINLSDVFSPFQITANTGAAYYVDNVRFIDSPTSPIFNVDLYNIADNQPASAITFNQAEPNGGWVLADQYIQLEVDANVLSWGVQIYTDNAGVDADPKWLGPGTQDPAGLIDATTKTQSLPMAWTIKTNGLPPPTAADPTNLADTNSFQWLFMKDVSTPDIAASSTTHFTNGEYYVTARSNRGIQFDGAPGHVGADNPPNQMYLQANFTSAFSPRTYKTSKLHLEFYQQ